MLLKVSNNLVQIYRLFSITGNYGRQSFFKYGISNYKAAILLPVKRIFEPIKCPIDAGTYSNKKQLFLF
jgi:hypothetical protein